MISATLGAAVACLLLMPASADSLWQATDGSVRGGVRDLHGVPLSDVSVTASSVSVPVPVVVATDDDGAYRLLNLAPGDYVLTLEHAGFKSLTRQPISVRAGLNLVIDFEMSVGTIEETVTVTGETPLIEASSAGQAVNVSGQLQQSLPLAARAHWSEFLRVVPGTVSNDTTADQASLFFVHGAGAVSGSILVDGADVSSAVNPWTGYVAFPEDTVADVQIRTTGLDASAPLGLGAAINIATRSGTNRYRGSATWAYTPQQWVSNNTSRRRQQPDDNGEPARSGAGRTVAGRSLVVLRILPAPAWVTRLEPYRRRRSRP